MMPVTLQQPAQAPSAPPIPPLPNAPGAATAAGEAAQAAQAARQDAQQALRDAQQALQDAASGGGPGDPGPATRTEIVVPPPYRQDDQIPKEVVPILGIVFGSMVVMVLGFPIVRLVTRLVDRRSDRGRIPAADIAAQLRTLQDSLDAMAIEVERISEAQRFQAKLAAEREKVALPVSRDEG